MSNGNVPAPALAPDAPAPKRRMPLFDIGRCVATPRALVHLEQHGVLPLALIARHAYGDWGDVCAEDAQSNEDGLQSGARIFSVYVIAGTKLYLVTEAVGDDGARSVSTILIASEY